MKTSKHESIIVYKSADKCSDDQAWLAWLVFDCKRLNIPFFGATREAVVDRATVFQQEHIATREASRKARAKAIRTREKLLAEKAARRLLKQRANAD